MSNVADMGDLLKVHKPHVIITRIYGVTSSSKYGDEVYQYYRSSLEAYLATNWSDATIERITKDLREQVTTDAIAELPKIAEGTATQADIINSIVAFVDKKAELAKKLHKAGSKVFPPLVELKSLIIGTGLEKGGLTAHMYDDVQPAFEAWKEQKLKIYTISTGPVDGQMAYFAHTARGDLSKYLSDGISTTNPLIKGTDTTIDYRNIASKIVQEEPENILLLTDKVNEVKTAAKSSIAVILIVRDNMLGHTPVTEELKEELSDYHLTSSLANIQFEAE